MWEFCIYSRHLSRIEIFGQLDINSHNYLRLNETCTKFTQKAFAIDSMLISIFQYFDFKLLCCVRRVNQQWLYKGYDCKSIVNVKISNIYRLIYRLFCQNFIVYRTHSEYADIHSSKRYTKLAVEITKFNLNMLKNCKNITVDTICAAQFKSKQIQTIFSNFVNDVKQADENEWNYKFDATEHLTIHIDNYSQNIVTDWIYSWIDINILHQVLTSIKFIFRSSYYYGMYNYKWFEIERFPIILSIANQIDKNAIAKIKKLQLCASSKFYCAKSFETLLKQAYIDNRFGDFTQVSQVKFECIDDKQFLTSDTLSDLIAQMLIWDKIYNNICQHRYWTSQAHNCKMLNRRCNIKDVHLVLEIKRCTSHLWENMLLDETESKQLMQVAKQFYQWYNYQNMSAILSFKVWHDDVSKYKDKLENIKWIQSIVQTMKTTFHIENSSWRMFCPFKYLTSSNYYQFNDRIYMILQKTHKLTKSFTFCNVVTLKIVLQC